jgi:hypothetical protein
MRPWQRTSATHCPCCRPAPPSSTPCPAVTQDVRLRAIEDGEFFGLMHFLTLAGTFTMSAYGGNRGEIGWDLLGFDRRHHWDPPFGHYDRGHHGEAEA